LRLECFEGIVEFKRRPDAVELVLTYQGEKPDQVLASCCVQSEDLLCLLFIHCNLAS